MRRVLVLGVFGVCFVGCASTWSSAAYRVQYVPLGDDLRHRPRADEAAAVFRQDVSSGFIDGIDVYVSAVPAVLQVEHGTVSVKAGADAQLLGAVLLSTGFEVPAGRDMVPIVQKAARAFSANVAFCPRRDGLSDAYWRCYLVRAAPGAAATPTHMVIPGA